MIGDIQYLIEDAIFNSRASVTDVSDRATTRALIFERPAGERGISVAQVEKTVCARGRRLSLIWHLKTGLPIDARVDAIGGKFGLSALKRAFDRRSIGQCAVGPRRAPHCESRHEHRIRDLGQDTSRRLPEGDYPTPGPRALTHVIDVVACVAFLCVTAVPLLATALS
jgi:hypothetical protein